MNTDRAGKQTQLTGVAGRCGRQRIATRDGARRDRRAIEHVDRVAGQVHAAGGQNGRVRLDADRCRVRDLEIRRLDIQRTKRDRVGPVKRVDDDLPADLQTGDRYTHRIRTRLNDSGRCGRHAVGIHDEQRIAALPDSQVVVSRVARDREFGDGGHAECDRRGEHQTRLQVLKQQPMLPTGRTMLSPSNSKYTTTNARRETLRFRHDSCP